MHSEVVALKKQLDHAYSRNRLPVAFIDESYQSEREGRPFYLTSASIVNPELIIECRASCFELAEGSWWHTTVAFQDGKRKSIAGFLNHLKITDIENFSCIQLDIKDNDLEHARRECLLQLSKKLEEFGCGLLVIERRQNQSARRSDTAVFSAAASHGYISKHLRLIQSTPSIEKLLWLPDVLSWSLRRHLAVNDSSWISMLDGDLTIIDASRQNSAVSGIEFGADVRKMKRPQLAVAKSCGPEKPIDSENEGVSRSSGLIMPQDFQSLQHFPQALGQVIWPPIDPATLSAWLKSRFPK